MTNCIKMKISAGGSIRNYMGFAQREFAKAERRLITFSGSGEAVNKVISCVEIMKRKHKDPLHQINKIFFKMKEDIWEPKEEDLDRLKVTRHIPAISVLLSKDPIDVNEPGYQSPGSFEEEWGRGTAKANANRKDNVRKKRTKLQQSGGSGRRERQKQKGPGQRDQSHKKHKQGQQDKSQSTKQTGPAQDKNYPKKEKSDG
ncbi:ribonuclease P protein subunit p25-like protein isoform X4 [Apostichopus japonicus]